MKKKYTWIRQITRVLMTLMLTIAVSVPGYGRAEGS